MIRFLMPSLAAVVLLSATTAFCAESPKIDLDQTIADLDSPLYRVRVAATQRLEKLGKQAQPRLKKLADHPSAEVRSRARQLLAKFMPAPQKATQMLGGRFVGSPVGPPDVDAGLDIGGFDAIWVDAVEEVDIIEIFDDVEPVEIVEIVEVETEVATPADWKFVPPAKKDADDSVAEALDWLRRHSKGESDK